MSKYSNQKLTINFLLHPLYLASRLSLVYFWCLVGWETENSHDAESRESLQNDTPILDQHPQMIIYTNMRIIDRTAGPLQVLQKVLTFSPKPIQEKRLTIAIQHSAQTDHPALSLLCIQPDSPHRLQQTQNSVCSPVPWPETTLKLCQRQW